MQAICALLRTPVRDCIQVVSIHRRTHLFSHSYLVTASDGGNYVLKVFPQLLADALIFREILAIELGTRLGLSMARWETLWLDQSVCDAYRDVSEMSSLQQHLLREGIYFASRVSTELGPLVEYLPQPLTKGSGRVAHQLGCVRIFDLWRAQSASRQYAVVMEESHPAHIYFFGHSRSLLAGTPVKLGAGTDAIYQAACKTAGSASVIEGFLRSIFTFTDRDLYDIVRKVENLWPAQTIDGTIYPLLRERRKALSHFADQIPGYCKAESIPVTRNRTILHRGAVLPQVERP